MSEREWGNPFWGHGDDGNILRISDIRLLLTRLESEHPTYLGPLVCSREFYGCPAFTFDSRGTRESTLDAIRHALEFGGVGWKGGIYEFFPHSQLYLNIEYGRLGVPLTMCSLGAYWMAAHAMQKALQK